MQASTCAGSWVSSDTIRITVINLSVPAINVAKTVYCFGENAVLTENVPAGPSYTINWYQGSTLLTANTNQTSIATNISGNYTVEVVSNVQSSDGSACSETSASQTITIDTPTVSIAAIPENAFCDANTAQLAANISSGSVLWSTGETTDTITVTQSGTYSVKLTTAAGCQKDTSITVTFFHLPVPTITIDKPEPDYCENAVLTETAPTDPSYTINWYLGTTLLTANTNQTSIATNVSGVYKVEVVNNQQDSDGSTCSQSSATDTITISPIPTISVAAIPENSFCDGQTVELVASFNSGSLLWSTGETSGTIKVTQSGTYKVTVTSAAGCQNDTSITVTFLANPVFTVGDTSICEYKRQPVTLTAPSGFAAYSWNGQTGGQTYTVTQPGTVSLTITDADGCKVTQQIKVADVCAAVYIPNTFTPNGDGVNDTWVVEGLDETATVKVFTRWGKQIYQSVGYPSPWNGEFDGKKLPQGVYYYVITAKNNTQKFSGWVTIIY